MKEWPEWDIGIDSHERDCYKGSVVLFLVFLFTYLADLRSSTAKQIGRCQSQYFFLINGPNLNLLGLREPHIYGSTTLKAVETSTGKQAEEIGVTLHTFQSNHEGAIIDRIHEARGNTHFIINPGALTHTSVALRDALQELRYHFWNCT
ncbi:type II 3-dehydroquinate dehydratase [Teratosphaeria nubilosa]|uniref:3-dehydroquinate dehydratase n=1 Tax=Teratosphaeria nubilosa TaxID=161662 RepID=A0A6G1LEY5_9PEZI|nr:type II 3-dehydroquinate dehydratase [Teratosphaeria nubilosa]